MHENIVVKPLTKDDLREYDVFPPGRSFSHSEQINRQTDSGYSLFGLFLDRHLAVVCHIRRQGPYDAIVRQSYSLPEIGNLYVLPSHRNQGLASRMLHELEKVLLNEGYEAVGLVVSSQNVAAIKLYEKFGYQPIQTFPSRKGKDEAERIYYLKQLT